MAESPTDAQKPAEPMPAGPPWYRTVTGWILVVNVCVFLLQVFWDNDARQLTAKGALSLDALRDGEWWRLLSFQFLHGGFLYLHWKFLLVGCLHLFLNSLAIYMFGHALEPGIGRLRLLLVYISSGVAGGLLQVFVSGIWPDHFYSPVVGASAGACGLVAMFATLFPEERLHVLLFFVIPVTMLADTVLWLMVILSVIGLSDVFKDGIAHAAHLGGILAGIWLGKRFLKKIEPVKRQI